MKRFWLLTIALFLLWADVLYKTPYKYNTYEFEPFYGYKTQTFIMNEVVGDSLQVDLLSDIPALLILIVLVCIGGPKLQPVDIVEENGVRKCVKRGRKNFCGKRSILNDIKAILAALLSIAAIVIIRLLPFYANGVTSYGGEYFTRLADIFLPLLATYFVMNDWISRTKIMTTEVETSTGGLMMMLSLFAGFFARFSDLYRFPRIHFISWILEGFMMATALFMLYMSLCENARKLPSAPLKQK